MQLRFTTPLVTTVAASGFKQGISAILSGLTVAGAFSTVIFSSNLASEKVNESLDKFVKVLKASPLYDGIAQVATTLKDWGSTVVGAKDDLKSWIKRYLGVDGLKSGVAQLAEKLRDWSLIVYSWFKDKFIEFIKNIPRMVKEWDKLRLSLFKWGTFLGGGGGSALWAMFGNGDNWDKLGELLGNPEFAEVVDKFSTLFEANSSAFAEMQKEEAQEIFEKILENPEEAKELVDELLEEQKEKNEEKKKELENKGEKDKEPKEELKKEEIIEKFKNSGGGSPKDPKGVFGNMISDGLQGLLNLPQSSLGSNAEFVAWNAMNDYIKLIKEEVKKNAKKAEVKKQFLEAIEGKEVAFASSLAKSAVKALNNLRNKKGLEQPQPKIEFAELAEEFSNVLEKEFTVEATNGEEGVSIRDQIPTKPRKKST